jgi:iron(III) transport system substrate-binding protein
MRSHSIWPSAAVAVFLAACGGGAPASIPSSPPTSAAAAPANLATAPPSAKPAASNAASGSWNDVLAGAKSEGQVVVLSQGGSAIAEALTAGFKQKYPDVKLDFTGATGAEIATKLLTERQAGKYSVDVIVHGTTTFITSLMPSGALDPLQPALVGPDDSDPKQWRDGYDFADDAGKYDLIFTGGVKVPMIYNPKLMSASDVTSYKDLLDPKWKGKIAMIDPRLAGAGLASATFWYVTPGLGKDFLDKFFTQQQVMLTPDDRQLTDWVAQGKYVIGLAAQDFSALDLKQRGVPIELLPAEGVKEGTYLTAAWGSAGLVNRAPHPNAARVYLNWILSKQGQEDVSKASGYPSRRLDTSNAGLRDSVVPKPGVNYQDNSKEQYVKLKDEIIAYLKPLIPAS